VNEEDRTIQGDLQKVIEHLFPDSCWDDSAADTARRVINAWKEFVPPIELPFKFTVFPSQGLNQLIACTNIEFSSMCAHHLMPYYGVAHVAYVPNQVMVGLSKIPRLVQYWARRPSTQEYVTERICSDLKDRLAAQGTAVIIHARHTCMACRGVRAHNGMMMTSLMKGVFMSSDALRNEFLQMIGQGRL